MATALETAESARPSAVSPRHLVILTGLLAGCVVATLVSLAWGTVRVPISDVVQILFGNESSNPTWQNIVHVLRLPRTITALLAGAGLGISGLTMQTLFRNPLAEPSIFGVSAGASLAVGLLLLPQGASSGFTAALAAGLGGMSSIGVVGAAASGALVVLLIMSAIAARVPSTTIVLIAGFMFAMLLMAMVNVLMFFARPEALASFTAWQLGSFQGVTWEQVPVFALVGTAGVAATWVATKPLNALLMGEGYAESVGVSVRAVRVGLLACTAVLAGVVTAYCGPIGFLGIAAPHLARALLGTSDHRVVISGSILVGMLLAVSAGILAQLPGSDALLPLNAAFALIGAPVVLHLLLRLHRHSSEVAP